MQNGGNPFGQFSNSVVNEIKNSPIILFVSFGTACVAMTRTIDDLDKKQAVEAAKIEAIIELLAKSIELSEYKGQSEINDTLMRMGYGSEYSEWRQGARKQKAEEGIICNDHLFVWYMLHPSFHCPLQHSSYCTLPPSLNPRSCHAEKKKKQVAIQEAKFAVEGAKSK